MIIFYQYVYLNGLIYYALGVSLSKGITIGTARREAFGRQRGAHDPDGFCHQLPGNRHLNALDGIYDMWYLNLTDRRPIHDAG